MPNPSKRCIRELGSRAGLRSDVYLGQFLKERIHIDNFRPIAELITSVEFDLLPCDRRELFE